MPGPDDESLEHLKRWMGKLFPVGTPVIDGQGDHHRVVGWYVSNERVRLKLIRTVRGKPISRDVAFDEVMGWARFPPEHDSEAGAAARDQGDAPRSWPVCVTCPTPGIPRWRYFFAGC